MPSRSPAASSRNATSDSRSPPSCFLPRLTGEDKGGGKAAETLSERQRSSRSVRSPTPYGAKKCTDCHVLVWLPLKTMVIVIYDEGHFQLYVTLPRSTEGSDMLLPRDGNAIAHDMHAVPAGEVESSCIRLFLDRARIESSKTGNAEKSVEPSEAHEMLRSDPSASASRLVGRDQNSIPGGSPYPRSQARWKTRAEKPETPKFAKWLAALDAPRDTTKGRQVTRACASCRPHRATRQSTPRTTVAETAQTAGTSRTSMKWASDRRRDSLAATRANRGNQPSLARAKEPGTVSAEPRAARR